jgi:hypothetical protein
MLRNVKKWVKVHEKMSTKKTMKKGLKMAYKKGQIK